MNKQEVLEKVKNLKPYEPDLYEYDSEELERFKEGFLDAKIYAELAVEKLDEPEKIVVPQCVADWFEDRKHNLELYISNLCVNLQLHKEELNDEFTKWYSNFENEPIQTLVKMKLYSYEVKKEKLYTARVKGLEVEYDKVYINQDKKTGELFIDDLDEIDGVFKVYFTKEELEKLGLWDNVLIEVEEG